MIYIVLHCLLMKRVLQSQKSAKRMCTRESENPVEKAELKFMSQIIAKLCQQGKSLEGMKKPCLVI